MKTVEEYRSYGQDFYHKLHLSTFPISIKYIKTEDEIPKTAFRPSAMGDKISICQAFTHVRNNGATVALMPNDNFCLPSSVQHRWVDIGFEDLIESQNLQGWRKDSEANKRKFGDLTSVYGTHDMDQLAKYCGLVCSPLHATTLIPDSILIFCNGVQMTHIIQSLSYEYKYVPTSSFDGFGESCIKGGLIPFTTQKPQIVIPGAGDRMLAGCTEHEMGIGLPGFLLFYLMDNLFKPGGVMNMGYPIRKMTVSGLPQNGTPGFAYLLEKIKAGEK